MLYVGILAAIVAVVVAIGVAWSRSNRPRSIPEAERIDADKLRATLKRSGIDLGSTNIPDASILVEYIAATDSFLGAIQARRGTKRAILVALGDRLVAGEATLGAMGADVRTFAWSEIRSFEQSFDIGGQLDFEVDGEAFTYTHLPRSQTRSFSDLLRERLETETT